MADMIENIAHQWRQPLSVITTSASCIKVNYEMGIQDDQNTLSLVDTVIESGQYLSHTIDTLRNNLIEEKEYKEVILQDRINFVIKSIKAGLENNNIDLIENVNDIDPIKIKTILGDISQVFLNIINNSKYHLIKNKINNPYIKIDLQKTDSKVVITIEDNAKGIQKDILPRVFDLYFTTKHKSQGAGLGLYMAKDIVEKHLHGNIYASNNSFGAVFTIILPVDEKL